MKNLFERIMLLLILLLLIVIIILLLRCRCCSEKDPVQPTGKSRYGNQLIVWRNPAFTTTDFEKWIKDSVEALGTISNRTYCASCDGDLVMLTGAGPNNYIVGQTNTGSGGTGKSGGPTGGDGPVYYSVNFAMNISDSVNKYDSLNVGRVEGFGGAPVTVAVFDTGADSLEVDNFLYANNDPSCLGPLSNNGWNFFNKTYDWKDDFPTRHGSIVSRFIINQVKAYGHNSVKILPVKIHSRHGVGNLFDVLCGFAYAANRKAQIINASFGFYVANRSTTSTTELDSSALLLKKYVQHYLTEKNILLIAAAGNKDDLNEDAVYSTTDTLAKRNLDSVSFYPASLARELQNVIAVTTVSDPSSTTVSVSPHQNYSSNVVDIGVNADTVVGDKYLFQNPRIFTPGKTVEGSSFATPIVTGKICANYFLIESMLTGTTPVNKGTLLDVLRTNSLLHINSGLASKIKRGLIMTK